MREEEREFFISLFGDYILLILCVYAISKKHLKYKKKNTFWFKIFLPIAGRREGKEGGGKRVKTKKEQYTHRINSNLPGESIARERKYCFCKQGEITPLLQKTIPNLNYFHCVMLKRRRTLKRYIRRENHPLLYIFILI